MEFNKLKDRVKNVFKAKKKIVLIGGGGLVLLAATLIFFNARSAAAGKETEMQFVQVSRGSIIESTDLVGTLEAQPMVELAWESGGIVSPFELKTGDKVKKDGILLALEENSLSSAILQAQSDLLDAQAELDNLLSANSALYTAAQTLTDAEYELRKYKTDRDYWNAKGSSWDAIEDARAAYYAAKQVFWEKETAHQALISLEADDPKRAAAYEDFKTAEAAKEKALRALNYLLGTYYDHSAETDFIEYDQAKAAVEAARVDYNRYLDQTDEIEAARANVQALQNTIDQARIVAPFDGTVTAISAVAGEKVASGDAAIRIDNLENLIVEVSVSEVDINKIGIGQKAIVTFDALPDKEYEGKVASLSSAGSDDSGVVEFSVSVKVLDANESVKPGFTAVVSIITSQVENALLVPNNALISRDGETAVLLANADGSTTIVPVETGASSDAFTEIISGDITEGNRLAVFSSENTGFSGMPMMGGMRVFTGGGAPPAGEQRRPQE